MLSCYTGSIVAEGDTYGIRINNFIQRICNAIVIPASNSEITGSVNVEALCRELQSYILDEAKLGAKKNAEKTGVKEKYDFHAAFNLFDADGQGTISNEEFRSILSRLKILDALPVEKIPELIKCFDPSKTGQVTYQNFIAFAADKKYASFADEDDLNMGDDDDDEEDENELPSSSNPPETITSSAECDWLLWALWKNAVRSDTKDTEAVITEIEAACTESEIESSQGAITDKDMWAILSEMKLKDGITKQQFDDGALFYAMDKKQKLAKGIDFESMCRGIIKMGRAYNFMIQERRKVDTKLYSDLKKGLLKELTEMMSSDALRPK